MLEWYMQLSFQNLPAITPSGREGFAVLKKEGKECSKLRKHCPI